MRDPESTWEAANRSSGTKNQRESPEPDSGRSLRKLTTLLQGTRRIGGGGQTNQCGKKRRGEEGNSPYYSLTSFGTTNPACNTTLDEGNKHERIYEIKKKVLSLLDRPQGAISSGTQNQHKPLGREDILLKKKGNRNVQKYLIIRLR